VVVSLNLLDPLLDAMEAPQESSVARTKKFDVRLLNPHPDCLAEITIDYPYLQERYEFFRLDMQGEERIDRPRVQFELMREAEAKYNQSTGEKLAHWQRRMIARYTRNLAHMSGDLLANVYDWPWPRARWWTTTSVGSVADGEPVSGAARGFRS